MKNKLFVRGAVIVVALMLFVSTVAFADAVAPTFDAENCAIVFDGGYTSSEDQVTLLAFAVPKGTEASAVADMADGTDVVAINQVAGSVGFTTVPINPTLFEEVVTENMDIAVLVGGSNGEVKPFVLSTDADEEEPTTYDVVYVLNDGTATGEYPATFTDETIAAFFANVANPTKAATETVTYAFEGWYTDAECTEANKVNVESTEAMSTLAGASTRVTLYANWTETPIVVEPTTYTASFAGDGVSIEAMTGNAEGATITLPAVPAKEGFTGVWNDGTTDYEGGATYTFGAADVTFTAVYTEVPVVETTTITVGDIDLGGTIDATDGTYLFEYASIALHPKNDPQREAVKAKYPTYLFAATRVVNK